MLGPASGSFIYARIGASLTHVIDGQLRQDNLEQVNFNRDFERKNSWLAQDSNP